MHILITGATGLIGTELVKQCLAKNYTVHYLTTDYSKIVTSKNYKGFYWNPSNGKIDVNCLNGIDTIINLAGTSISKRWSKKHKKRILESRIQSTQLLYLLLSKNKHNITQLCSASALGIYPSSLTKQYDETETEINLSFLGNVVHAWETEVEKFNNLNIVVSKIRIGIVLSKVGGALPQIIKPIRFGLGAAIGSGKQWLSWIEIKDLAHLFLFIVENRLSGIYNAAASNPVTNKEMTQTVAKKLQKYLWLPNIPAFILKLALGEQSSLVLESQYLLNDKLKKKGFAFEYETLEEMLDETTK